MNEVIIANLTWNPFGWRNNSYINPKAGHKYAQNNVGGEALNFNFSKKTIDTDLHVHGFIQWKYAPIKFDKGGLIIFYTRNTDEKKGQIVGIYGKSEIFSDAIKSKVPFQKDVYWTNVRAEKNYSILFPLPLDADNYKLRTGDRMVGQIGFTYKDQIFAEKILFDELTELSRAGHSKKDFDKLSLIYEHYTGKKFLSTFISQDEKEQEELEKFLKKNKTNAEILKDLENLKDTDPEQITVNHKTYKRDNKTIAQIKILRDFKCQICSKSIVKRDGSKYIEAAHIVPKHLKGRERLANIILLCPNHHKEFDFGKLIIKLHDNNQIHFLLNGEDYKVKLSFDPTAFRLGEPN